MLDRFGRIDLELKVLGTFIATRDLDRRVVAGS
jgi:hypothetical protein